MKTLTTTLTTTLLVALVLGGCGDDAGESTSETAAADDTATEETSEDVSTGASADVVAVTAVDYAFEDLPPTVTVGTELTLTNASDRELHELVAVRLPDDEERPVEELIALPPDEVAAFFPLVTTVVIAPPAADGFVVEGSATLAEPGRYLFLCAIPTGADPQVYLEAAAEAEGGPPDVPGGPPHFVQGMFAEVVVATD